MEQGLTRGVVFATPASIAGWMIILAVGHALLGLLA
jgi:hypothetical protein